MLNLTSEIKGKIYSSDSGFRSIEDCPGEIISLRTVTRPEFQAELFNFRFQSDEIIIFSEIPWPYTLGFVFGHSVTLCLSTAIKKDIHDRGSQLFYLSGRPFKVHFNKAQNYILVLIHYSAEFVRRTIEDNANLIWTRGAMQSPAFYFDRSVIAVRETIELLSMFWFPGNAASNEDYIIDELGRKFLLDFVSEDHFFQPVHLGAKDFETFYKERDELAKHALEIRPLSTLLKLSGIRHDQLFRKRLNQLYKLNIRGFLTEMRMANAIQFLKDPTLSIKEIAAKSGFASPFYFSRVFADYFSLPPKSFHAKNNL